MNHTTDRKLVIGMNTNSYGDFIKRLDKTFKQANKKDEAFFNIH